jgi:hypothetical protein
VKSHLFQSEFPIVEGASRRALCGHLVQKVKLVFMWDELECGIMHLSGLRTCRQCIDVLESQPNVKTRLWLYGIREAEDDVIPQIEGDIAF